MTAITQPQDITMATASTAKKDQAHSALREAQDQLRNHLVGREEEADLLVLGLVSQQHVALIGPPGCGKSQLIRGLHSVYDGGDYFEAVVQRFTTPEDLFGPLSIPELKQGKHRRNTACYLPEAEFAFLDEVFNASPAVLNTLLGVMNERKFRNGDAMLNCPLQLMVGASNHWPVGDEYKGLGALFDRFLIRTSVDYADDIESVVFGGLGKLTPCVTKDEVQYAAGWASSMKISQAARTAYLEIIAKLRAEGVNPSDRRCRQSLSVARAAAFLDGADEVEPQHLSPLRHTLWNDPKTHVDITEEIVLDVANPGQRALVAMHKQLKDLVKQAEGVTNFGEVSEVLHKMNALQQRAAGINDPSAKSIVKKIGDARNEMMNTVALREMESGNTQGEPPF